MEKRHFTILIASFIFFLTSCSETKLNNLELKLVGEWNKDWNKSLKYAESKPELKDYLFGLKMVAKMQSNHNYIFNNNRTFELNLGNENLAGEKSEGNWSISKDSILIIETTKSSKSGILSKNKSGGENILTYKLTSLNSNEIELKQLTDTLSELPEFMTKIED